MNKKGLGEIQQEIERLKARVGQLEEKLGIRPGEDEKVLDREKAQTAESKELKPAPESL